MKFSRTCLFLILAASLTPGAAHATLLQFTGQGTVDRSFSFSADYFPLGTVLNASIAFDVSGTAGVDRFPIFGAATGIVTWNDRVPREFTVTGTRASFMAASGLVGVHFVGTGPTINSIEPRSITAAFDIGENPFFATDPWDELFLGSTTFGLGAWLQRGGSGVIALYAQEDVSGSVTIPEPSTTVLVLAGLVSVAARRRPSH